MVGQTISTYQIQSKLGSGGMGDVYLAHCTRLDREVAIKLLPGEKSGDERRRRRFLAEAKAASALNHPNVCVIHEVGETNDGRPYIVMEYIAGKTLESRTRHAPMPIQEVVRIGAQMADALDAAFEKGIVHRDIKPANISLNPRGHVKILDFGLAKRLDFHPVSGQDATTLGETRAGQVLGTPGYMSPEQALGRTVDHRTDIFSVGIVLYEMVCGCSLFSGNSLGDTINKIVHLVPSAPHLLIPSIPIEFERILYKCLEKDPNRRYQSPRDLLIDLQALQRRLDVGAPIDIFDETPEKQPSSSRRPAVSIPEDPPPRTDVYISYASIDDHPVLVNHQGWISQFHKDLKVRVEQLSGDSIQIWRRPADPSSGSSDHRVLDLIPGVKIFVAVVSPPFIKSSQCRKEVELFWRTYSGNRAAAPFSESRLFKVVKRPVPVNELSPPLSDIFPKLNDFEFYDIDEETGRLREFDESFGPDARRQYLDRIYDLAREIHDALSLHEGKTSSLPEDPCGSKTIYLAETSSDLRQMRDRLRRELLERGHIVLPDQPLPILGPELELAVADFLERSDLSLHLVGRIYGLVPEGARQSLIEIQNRIAMDTPAFRRMSKIMWVAPQDSVEDERQVRLIEGICRNPTKDQNLEVIQGNYKILKEVLLEKLNPSPVAPDHSANNGRTGESDGTPSIYLICDSVDEQATEAVEDWLFEMGFNVLLPDFEAGEGDTNRIHLQNLKDCDAALVYFGRVGRSWVEIKLRDLVKIAGYGRTTPIAAQAVLIAPPADRRKDRFRWHNTLVLRQGSEFDPEIMRPFINDLQTVIQNLRKTPESP